MCAVGGRGCRSGSFLDYFIFDIDIVVYHVNGGPTPNAVAPSLPVPAAPARPATLAADAFFSFFCLFFVLGVHAIEVFKCLCFHSRYIYLVVEIVICFLFIFVVFLNQFHIGLSHPNLVSDGEEYSFRRA